VKNKPVPLKILVKMLTQESSPTGGPWTDFKHYWTASWGDEEIPGVFGDRKTFNEQIWPQMQARWKDPFNRYNFRLEANIGQLMSDVEDILFAYSPASPDEARELSKQHKFMVGNFEPELKAKATRELISLLAECKCDITTELETAKDYWPDAYKEKE